MMKCRFCSYCIGYERIFCVAHEEREISESYAKRSRICPDYIVSHDGKDDGCNYVDIWGEVPYNANLYKQRIKKNKNYEKLKLFEISKEVK